MTRLEPILAPSATSNMERDKIAKSIQAFLAWLDDHGYAGSDPYDIWGTPYGLFARRLYYKHSTLGLPLIAPILASEILCPEVRTIFVEKQRYATADGQLLLAFLNLYQDSGASEFLGKARKLAQDLLQYSIPGYKGHCWGYPFDWQHNRGVWKKNTPFITATPYCFEAFLALFDVTGDESCLAVAESIARFVHGDLAETPLPSGAAAGSYSPLDNSQVINATAYRAMVLFEAAHRFNQAAYQESAERNLQFILESQREDGAWLYALDHRSERFIDHFHTCFVLKNLVKLNARRQDKAVSEAIARGYRYYHEHLFGPDGLPRSFAIKPRTQIVRLEMYDFAEAITLGCLLRHEMPNAFALARSLAGVVCGQFQLPDGHFVTRVYVGGLKHTFPYLRWPQSQLFYALTNILLALQ